MYGLKNNSFYYWRPPKGSRLVMNGIFILQIKLLSFRPKIEETLKNRQITKKLSKKSCKFSRSWCIFWHPWDPWGHINSGGTRVLRIFIYLSASGGFFHPSPIEARFHFYWFDMNKKWQFYLFFSHNGWLFKVIQAVCVVIWKESDLISSVCGLSTTFQNKNNNIFLRNSRPQVHERHQFIIQCIQLLQYVITYVITNFHIIHFFGFPWLKIFLFYEIRNIQFPTIFISYWFWSRLDKQLHG